ncbi:MAG: alpha/beta fold hydrolase [Candidatus Krumholzibacteriia bacterium]
MSRPRCCPLDLAPDPRRARSIGLPRLASLVRRACRARRARPARLACLTRLARPARLASLVPVALLLAALAAPGLPAMAQQAPAAGPPTLSDVQDQVQRVLNRLEGYQHRLDVLEKKIDDVLWFERVGDVARVDKVRIWGPPKWREESETAIGAGNPVKFYAYVILPRDVDRGGKIPLLVFPHGGVHADFSTYYAHIVRELVAQGYAVVAPEYRGSTGYGRDLYESIDYGGLEVEDAHAARQYMLENYAVVDEERVGLIGWSHGGLISLMAAFRYPDDYAAVYAGVPVSDLISRLGYLDDDYRALYSADYHIGQQVHENIAEYRRRSPVWHADKLQIPLLIHTNTSDEDVNVLEVEHLIHALKAAEKDFEYEIYRDAPGGHSFDRLDTRQAQEIRLKVYRFLARHLSPPEPLETIEELHAAGYR